ncbi:MAG: hypothetical protein IK096_00695, partial [Lachnospiraceae bacterium]|nr:hypothetical protein [Lachnospiraceae bacterium]
MEDLVAYEVEPVSEQVLIEAIHVENRSQGDPFLSAGDGVDDALSWTAEIPTYYDANDRNGEDIVTDVRNQGGTHLCWAYAAMGAIEANLLIKHPTLGVDRLDLSEKHLAWYAMNQAQGSAAGGIDGDYRELQGIGDDAEQDFYKTNLSYTMTSGVTDYIISVLAAWKGPVDDKDANAFDRQRNGKLTIKDQGAPSGPYGTDYHVQGVYELAGTEVNREAIKRMILSYGGVTCSVHADQAAGNSYWYLANLYDGAPYAENNNLADHEVLVVGWDDEYETDNFKPEPMNTGAWYCRNSWGATAGDMGYFWLSYDDVIFQNNNVAAYDVALRGDPDFYDKNYQVAGLMTHVIDMMIDQNNVVYAYTPSVNPYGVLYTAESDETLKAISLYSMETENAYDVAVYLNPERTEEGGISASYLQNTAPDLTQTVRSASGGYHTYAFDTELPLSAGTAFLIMVTPSQASGLVYEKAMTSTGDANYDEDGHYIGNVFTQTVASNQSFYLSEDGTAFVPQTDKDFFIKAFTNRQ